MSNPEGEQIWAFFGGVMVGIVGGFLFGVFLVGENFRAQAVTRGYASYNPTNGVWQWKETK